MEKVLSPDEKIKRAEEIYYKRKINNTNLRSTRVNISEKKDFGMLKKMLLQILICFIIYLIFYMIQNTNYIFSEGVINKAKEVLSYDINLGNLYGKSMEYINSFASNLRSIVNDNENKINTESEIINDNLNDEESNNDKEENIGGESVEENKNENEDLTQMEKDAKDILSTKSLVIPLKGTITSRFGLRNPETPTVPKNHTGIDIAANLGTVFIASMSGKVEEVSNEGDLGNHVKIINGDVMTVYAHCKSIYVKKGEYIEQGKEIGEVGSTGNSTGPHLHFEIRKDGRYVDPDLILKF